MEQPQNSLERAAIWDPVCCTVIPCGLSLDSGRCGSRRHLNHDGQLLPIRDRPQLDHSRGAVDSLVKRCGLTMMSLLLHRMRPRAICIVFAGIAALLFSVAVESSAEQLQVYPDHTRLPVGEQIRYSVFHLEEGEPKKVEDYSLYSADRTIVRVVDRWLLEAMSPGTTDVLIRSEVGQRLLSIDVSRGRRPPMPATHHSAVDRLVGEELLFVGHANLDGFDHTAVAKPGIDRLVREFKAHGHPVIYFVSEDYPYWYTEDRQPDLAIVSEGQEHEILVDAERIVFTGGDFMFCTPRNAQMTLHGMLKAKNRERINFVFTTDAIWAVDIFAPGRFRPYPAPMELVDHLFSEHSSYKDRYEHVVVPFVKRLIEDFPVIGYPATAPEPPLKDLVDGWTIEVAIGSAFMQRYRSGDPNKVIRLEFVSSSGS